jgi:predicted ATPase/class 3 adenylate cyclase
LELVGRHLSNREIAGRLYLSVRTVESHVASLIRKLGVADRRALAARASGAPASAPGGGGGLAGATQTFLFTDIAGATRLWQADRARTSLLVRSDGQVIAGAVEGHGGRVFQTAGEATCSVFPSATEAVRAAVDAQPRLELPVRMAVHTGEAVERDGDFFGPALSRCARLVEAAHGHQVLVSAASARVVAEALGPGVSLKPLGEHRLRDFEDPEPVFQVLADGLPAEFPPLRTLRVARHNLPLQRSSFIGRTAERAQVGALVVSEALVTLTGIGGCGKTRLALAVAADVLAALPGGVFFVDLAVVSDPGLVGQAVATAAGLQMPDTGPQALAGYFAGRELLLVLDNCEHLVDSCAGLAEVLMAACPRLHLLATSREALGVDGEKVVPVPSLQIGTEAVELFAERARAARPGVRFDAQTLGVVAEICRRLDGIPLAIELAAGRAGHLSAAEILDRLNDRFRLLVGGRRRIQRQQTLGAALDWSYGLLSPEEQRLLRGLAVFRGSFSLRAAEGICHPAALDLLGSLVAKSLVALDDRGAEARYRLGESVRIYAEDKLLATDEPERLRSAHRDWYLAWLSALPVSEISYYYGDPSRVAAEADNLVAALEWSRQQERHDLCAAIAVRMVGYWFAFMRVAEMLAWWRELDAGLAATDREHRAMALLLRSRAALATLDGDELNACSAQALAMAEPDSWMALEALHMQAMYWSFAGPEHVQRILQEVRRIEQRAGLPPNLVMDLIFYHSRLRAVTSPEEALAVLGEWKAGSAPSPYLAGLFALYGDTTTAADVLSNVAAVHTPMARFTLESAQAVIASAQGQFATAEHHLSVLATVARDHAVWYGEAACLIHFAKLALDRGDPPSASRLLATVKASAGPNDPPPFRTHFDRLVYFHCTRQLRSLLDQDSARKYQREGALLSCSRALDAELASRNTRRPSGGAAGAR